MDMTGSERRKYFRVEVVTPVRFRLIDEKTSKPLTEWRNGKTADVSLGGVKVSAPIAESEVETLVGEYVLVELSFKLPGASRTIASTASIAYFLRGATVLKATTVTFGVSFVSIENSAKDIIGEFIRKEIGSPA